ncbi:MAG: hypothetical protein ACI9TH_001096 [Kiritimatiellia bacterium]|jgi:hypothetical protein
MKNVTAKARSIASMGQVLAQMGKGGGRDVREEEEM